MDHRHDLTQHRASERPGETSHIGTGPALPTRATSKPETAKIPCMTNTLTGEPCTEKFARPSHLKRHLANSKLHNAARDFVCPICLKSYTRGDSLDRHRNEVKRCNYRSWEQVPNRLGPSSRVEKPKGRATSADQARPVLRQQKPAHQGQIDTFHPGLPVAPGNRNEPLNWHGTDHTDHHAPDAAPPVHQQNPARPQFPPHTVPVFDAQPQHHTHQHAPLPVESHQHAHVAANKYEFVNLADIEGHAYGRHLEAAPRQGLDTHHQFEVTPPIAQYHRLEPHGLDAIRRFNELHVTSPTESAALHATHSSAATAHNHPSNDLSPTPPPSERREHEVQQFPPGASRPNLTWTAPLTADPSTEVEVKRAGGVPTALPAGVEVAPSGEFICRKDRNDGQHCGKIFSKKNDAVRHANTARVHVAQKSVTCPSCGRAFTRQDGLIIHQNKGICQGEQ